jgi:hypothetical protein
VAPLQVCNLRAASLPKRRLLIRITSTSYTLSHTDTRSPIRRLYFTLLVPACQDASATFENSNTRQPTISAVSRSIEPPTTLTYAPSFAGVYRLALNTPPPTYAPSLTFPIRILVAVLSPFSHITTVSPWSLFPLIAATAEHLPVGIALESFT